MTATSAVLSEDDIIKGFHSFVSDALAQTRGEGLLSDEEIATGDVDVQIAGPALALFFAALGAKGDPPSIDAPDGSFSLASDNCPPSFQSFFSLWQSCVHPIQRLSSDARHDLALTLCDKEPLSSPIRVDVMRLAGSLKSVTLEIIQRRTFQQRYQADLQFALDSQVRPRTSQESDRASTPRAQFAPPPEYAHDPEQLPSAAGEKPGLAVPSRPVPRPPSPADPRLGENLSVIRETLYSALADCLVETPSISAMLSRGPEWASRGFFASTCLAILQVALERVDSHGVRVVNFGGGSPKLIGINETPNYLRPFLSKLLEVSGAAKILAEQDDRKAMQEAAGGVTSFTTPKLDTLKDRLERGAANSAVLDSNEAEITTLANAINELAIGMASLPAFAERQQQVFQILSAVTSF